MATAFEVFDCRSGQVFSTVKTEAEANRICDATPQSDYEPVTGFWIDNYNDHSVSERFVRSNA